MSCDNKNPVLTLYFHEGRPSREKSIRSHLETCEECRNYLKMLEMTGRCLDAWEDEKPAPETFDRILSALPARPPRPEPARTSNPLFPLAGIAAAIAVILAELSLVQRLLARLPFWNSLGQSWPLRDLGSAGLSVLTFFALGAFAALALAPFLYFQSRHNGSCS
jgi:anti-sigma factor RsiW